MTTVIQSQIGISSRQHLHLSALADELCADIADDRFKQQHRELSEDLIHLLITNYPDCPRWASLAVDQLTAVMEVHG